MPKWRKIFILFYYCFDVVGMQSITKDVNDKAVCTYKRPDSPAVFLEEAKPYISICLVWKCIKGFYHKQIFPSTKIMSFIYSSCKMKVQAQLYKFLVEKVFLNNSYNSEQLSKSILKHISRWVPGFQQKENF